MYDLKELKAIKLEEVANKYNIPLKQVNGRLWGKLREEGQPSFSINLEKNLWYDFGSSRGGSTIDLVAEIEGISAREAINKLAQMFGINNESVKGWCPLTDNQYQQIGINPTMATLNFSYDLRVHTQQQLERWNSKYAIPMKELAERYPDDYNYLVKKIAGDHINELKDLYFYKLRLALDNAKDNSKFELYTKWAEADAKDINTKVDLLHRALKSATSSIARVDVQNDYKELANNKQSQMLAATDADLIKTKIVQNYKSLYNFNQAEFLTPQQAMELYSFNLTITQAEDKYLDIYEIKDIYNSLGTKLQNVESLYKDIVKQGEFVGQDGVLREEWKTTVNKINSDMVAVKELFIKCSSVIDSIRQANTAYKNANISQINRDNIPINTYTLEL